MTPKNAARQKTDKELARIEKKLNKIYTEAEHDLRIKWNTYMEDSAKAIKSYETEYKVAVQSEDAAKIKIAKKNLKNAKYEQTIYNKHYKEMVEDIATRTANVNAIALTYVNAEMAKIYLLNHNAIAPTAKSLGIDFTIVNERAVKNLVKSGTVKLPKKKINIAKDKRWNKKFINSQVTQGIVQGESMQQIANRIFPEIYEKAGRPTDTGLIKRCEDAAIRNARTLVTAAENLGTLESYIELQEQGVILRKVWVAEIDNRTRDSHIEMNGEEAEVLEPFSNKLMYPADPEGDASEVYNCRCTMKANILGFVDNNGVEHEI